VLGEHGLDHFQEALGQAGLRHEGVAARLQRALGVPGQRVPGQRDHGNGLGPIVRLQAARRLPAVDARQREVHHDEVRQERERLLERLVAVVGLLYAQPGEGEELGVHLPIVREVVDEEDHRRLS